MWRAFALVLLILPGLPARAETPASVARLFHQQGNFDGVVVVAKHGKVTYAEGFGSANRAKGYPNTRDTPYRICSLTRQFTALLAMQQVQQGWLRLDGTLRNISTRLVPRLVWRHYSQEFADLYAVPCQSGRRAQLLRADCPAIFNPRFCYQSVSAGTA